MKKSRHSDVQLIKVLVKPMSVRIPAAVVAAVQGLREAVDREGLPYSLRVRLALALKRELVPRRKPGPRCSRLDAAYDDYRVGVRGLELFRKHIPNHDKLSQWRRATKEKRLLNALQKRASRERQRRELRQRKRGRWGERGMLSPAPDSSASDPSG